MKDTLLFFAPIVLIFLFIDWANLNGYHAPIAWAIIAIYTIFGLGIIANTLKK